VGVRDEQCTACPWALNSFFDSIDPERTLAKFQLKLTSSVLDEI
jgi:hypothetical protein